MGKTQNFSNNNKIEEFNFNESAKGFYKIKVKYTSVNPEIYSNELEFKIT